MAAFRYPRRTQPTGPIGVDWGNPITRGLQIAALPVGNTLQNAVNGRLMVTSGSPTRAVTRDGAAFKTVLGSSQFGYFDVDISGGPATIFLRHTLDASSSQAVAALDTASGTVRAVLFYGSTAGSYSVNLFTNTSAGDAVLAAPTGVSTSVTMTLDAAQRGKVFVNGIAGTSTAGTWVPSGISRIHVSARVNTSAGAFASQRVNTLLAWDRTLSDAEIKSLSENPWQIFTPQARQIWVPSSGGGVNYSLTCNAGAFSLVGQDATLSYVPGTANYTLTCDAGSFALAGQDATLTYTPGSASVAYTLLCDVGAYALAGQDATLTYVSNAPVAYSLACEAGAYSISGQEATLTFSGQRATPSNEVELRNPKRWYVKREKQIFVFRDASEADAFIAAEKAANEAIEQAQRTSRRARKRLRERVYKVAGVAPEQTIQVDWLAQLVERFNVPVDIPSMLAHQDYAHVMRIFEEVMRLQDDEDIELLLLG